MAREFRQVDEHGFPVPPRFEDWKHLDAEPPRRPKFTLRTKRLVLLALLIGVIVPVIFGPQIASTGRELLAHWLSSRAERKYWDRDYTGALADLSRAIDWNPNNISRWALRAQWREEQNDLQGSLVDWDETIRLIEIDRKAPNAPNRRRRGYRIDLPNAYSKRAWVNVRLGRGREAIDDANEAVRLRDKPEMLNNRAYFRALLNLELEAGLADIERALAPPNHENARFLDTRGYLHYLRNENEEALRDLDRAIKLTTKRFQQDPQRLKLFLDPQFAAVQPDFDAHDLAVMHHHRGLIYEKLGRPDEAARDLRRGNQLGYDPANGVF